MIGIFDDEIRISLGELTGLERYQLEQAIRALLSLSLETAPAGNDVLVLKRNKWRQGK
jgi:hypothetical protein